MKTLSWCWLMPMFLWPHIEGNVLPISSLTQPSLAQSFYSHSLDRLPFTKYAAQVCLPYESCFLFFSRRLVTLADSIFWWRFRLTHHKTVFSNILCLIDPPGCKTSTGRIISSTVFTLKLPVCSGSGGVSVSEIATAQGHMKDTKEKQILRSRLLFYKGSIWQWGTK